MERFLEKHSGKIQKVAAFLLIFLFAYAALEKSTDYDGFLLELGQSPLLSTFAGPISLGVPLIESICVILLAVERFRKYGFYLAFLLMVSFTVYIILILGFADFVPCSCGGILEEMGWYQHLIFNIVFIGVAALGALSHIQGSGPLKGKARIAGPYRGSKLLGLGTLSILGTLGVVILFLVSENEIRLGNGFIRRFPHQPATKVYERDLVFDSYYFAGMGKDSLFLANHTAPLHLLVLDTTLKVSKQIRIGLDRDDFPYRAAQVRVIPPHFFVLDGTVPVVQMGTTDHWMAKTLSTGREHYFNLAEPVDDRRLIIRAQRGADGKNVLGALDLNTGKIQLSEGLLETRIDGFFGSDGILQIDPSREYLTYGYYYRNGYLVFDPDLNPIFRGKTIDTVKSVRLDFVEDRSKGQRKLAQRPLLVNKFMGASDGKLFVLGQLIGKYETEQLWDTASVIDVYDIGDGGYLFSFYIYDIDGDKLRSFKINGNLFYGLIGDHIVGYRLDHKTFDREADPNVP
ncbi:MauE/DoxX family redox-associated membrane protein [Sediminicola luteus]|uniref:Methylamine utilisation protein MauE domain-containing protein n=1 Tax=Sediminicola luteus TaxID=319238 RepID=A0A2A4G4V7_9FLAO|nr:MauE/DoxX family redox-associated membrane protein [Sediminicola luteus]PCE63020.1 hypothetical protein B7P33_17250 [Sediminicola luteus]